jgi:hypothetical protein
VGVLRRAAPDYSVAVSCCVMGNPAVSRAVRRKRIPWHLLSMKYLLVATP